MRQLQLIALLVAGLCTQGCSSIPAHPALLKTQPLPDAFAHQTYFKTENEEIKLQVATLLGEQVSKRHVLADLRGEDVLALYLRAENLSPTRILISNADCHLYGKEGEKYVEIPQVPIADVAGNFRGSNWSAKWIVLPIQFVSVIGWFSMGNTYKGMEQTNIRNGILYELFMGIAWNRRTLGPGGTEKGLLFFDWDLAEEYRDELYVAIDMRDMVNDWHVVAPVKVKVVYTDGWFSTTYH